MSDLRHFTRISGFVLVIKLIVMTESVVTLSANERSQDTYAVSNVKLMEPTDENALKTLAVNFSIQSSRARVFKPEVGSCGLLEKAKSD